MNSPIRVLMVTNEWPTPGRPRTTYFVKRQAEFLRAAGVDVDVFQFEGAKKPSNYLRAWVRLQNRLRRERYDLVHAQFGQSGLLALPKRVPLVVTFRGSDLLGVVSDTDGSYTRAGKILNWLCRRVALHADAAIVVSEHMKNFIHRSVEAHVIPSGIDLDLFRCTPRDEARRRLGLPPGERLVLFVGNPSQARKRFELAERAVEILNRSLPSRLVVAWGVPHTDIPLYLSACDALVFTSMQEGSPNAVKEALACNLPVVSVPVGDVASRLRGVEGCELCADERPETIAAALGRVLRRGQRINGRDAVSNMDEKLLTDRVIDIYRSAMLYKQGRRTRAGGDGRGRAEARTSSCPPELETRGPAFTSRGASGGLKGDRSGEIVGEKSGGAGGAERDMETATAPLVTVVIPCRNEAAFISRSLDAVLAQDYPSDRVEIIVADGMSDDGTREIVKSFQARHPNLRLIDNPGRIVPTGLNAAIAQSRGEIVARVDGHCEIARDYIRRCVAHLLDDAVDGVGGSLETVGETPLARVIAAAMSCPFGVGDSFRAVGDKTMLTDNVAFTAYTRATIDRAGPFDEELIRNQDDEYNYRLRKMGAKILLAADMRSRYYSRSSLRSLWRQYFQYGYWKVRCMQKNLLQMRPRQFVPPLFVSALLLTLLTVPISMAGRWMFGLAIGSYLTANLVASALAARRVGGRLVPLFPVTFATIHISYGLGFLVGLVKFRGRWGDRETRVNYSASQGVTAEQS